MTLTGLDDIEAEDAEQRPLTRAERLRRVMIVCSNGLRCLATWQACLDKSVRPLLTAEIVGVIRASFWRQVQSNAADVAVLDWWKLFNGRERHSWQGIVCDQNRFTDELRSRANFTSDRLEKLVKGVKRQRNKFIAHLDDKRTMFYPLIADLRILLMTLYVYMVAVEGAQPPIEGARTWKEIEAGYAALHAEALEIMHADLARWRAESQG